MTISWNRNPHTQLNMPFCIFTVRWHKFFTNKGLPNLIIKDPKLENQHSYVWVALWVLQHNLNMDYNKETHCPQTQQRVLTRTQYGGFYMPPQLESNWLGAVFNVASQQEDTHMEWKWAKMSGVVLKSPRLWNFKDCQKEQAQLCILEWSISESTFHMYQCCVHMCVNMCVTGWRGGRREADVSIC